MIMTGQHFNTKKCKKSGLLDAVVPKGQSIVDEACKFVLSKGGKTRPISKMTAPMANKIMAKAGGLDMALLQSDKAMKGMIAPEAICRCVAAAVSLNGETFKEGCELELNEFLGLVMSKESAGLRNVFFSERAATKVKGAPKDVKPAKLNKVGVVGAGLMGGGIAMCFIKKGVQVVLKDAKKEWLDGGMATIKKNYDITVAKKKMTREKADKEFGLIKPTLDYKDFADVDMVIEAVPEIMSLKKEVFTELGKVLKKDAILCTNTSGLDIDEIATAFPDPTRVMGAHFFSPANVMQLLENVRTAKASMHTIVSAMAMGKLIGKKAILVGNCDGFIGNRMLGPYGAEAQKMIMEGAGIEQVDDCIGPRGFGVAMGPISMADMVGLDLFWKARKAKGDPKAETKVSMGPFDLGDWLCESGMFGQKASKGMFLYDAKTRKKKGVNEECVKKVDELRAKFGYKPRAIKDEEIVERMMYSLVNEGFKILDEGFAQRPSDIDIAYIYGYGHPPVRGGPMHWADNWLGLDEVLEKLKKWDAHAKQQKASNPNYWYHDYFVPSKLLEESESTTMIRIINIFAKFQYQFSATKNTVSAKVLS